ncbi:hypothetical protein ANN_18560 [Periplaneta americana]|uniref:BHLH domain-containing protein n=1 Tax=Periplaneta americana TaxID=6978 RepID=A0ABQ8SPK3_PERAM|nr:hypothetical protein ANN_18560 [Periplaneta americana]
MRGALKRAGSGGTGDRPSVRCEAGSCRQLVACRGPQPERKPCLHVGWLTPHRARQKLCCYLISGPARAASLLARAALSLCGVVQRDRPVESPSSEPGRSGDFTARLAPGREMDSLALLGEVLVFAKEQTDPNNNAGAADQQEDAGTAAPRRGEKYSLRPRSLQKRAETEERGRAATGSRPKKGETARPKQKPPPLSKYRRKTANARERDRMREINAAFETLRRAVPHISASAHQNPPDGGEKLTKITTLRLAMKYIAALSQALQETPTPSHQLMSDGESLTFSEHCLTPPDLTPPDFTRQCLTPADLTSPDQCLTAGCLTPPDSVTSASPRRILANIASHRPTASPRRIASPPPTLGRTSATRSRLRISGRRRISGTPASRRRDSATSPRDRLLPDSDIRGCCGRPVSP